MTSLNYRNMDPDAAAAAYADDISKQEAISDHLDARATEIQQEMERAILAGEIYHGHSLLSVMVNANDANSVVLNASLAAMLRGDQSAQNVLLGVLSAEVTLQATQESMFLAEQEARNDELFADFTPPSDWRIEGAA